MRYLITGALGQLGPHLARSLRGKLGQKSVITSDVHSNSPLISKLNGPHMQLDITNSEQLKKIVKQEKITHILHLAALLSFKAETHLKSAVDINIHSLFNIFQTAKEFELKLYVPSTIGAFGPDSPLDHTPDLCIQRPRSIYGVSKVYCELLGEYFYHNHGVDFRSLRYPGIISSDSEPGGGTTDYAVAIFHEAYKTRSYTCYLKPDTRLPMMLIDDCIRATTEFIQEKSEILDKQRVYNISSISFTPEELAESIRKHWIKDFKIVYQIDPLRQSIAESWPRSFDDSQARKVWKWKPQYDLDQIVIHMRDMIEKANI